MTKLIENIKRYYKSKTLSLFFYPLACLLYEEGSKEEAFDILIEGASKFPKYSLALIKIAQILLDEEKYLTAQAYLETAININNANNLAWELLAKVFEKQNKIEQAIACYEKLLILDPSLKIKSKILALAAQYKPSLEQVTSIPLQPSQNAEKLQSDVLILNVDENSSQNNQINIADEFGDTKIKFEEIPTIDLEEDDQLNIAKLYVEQDYLEDAKNLYKEILEKNPQNQEAKKALEELNEKL